MASSSAVSRLCGSKLVKSSAFVFPNPANRGVHSSGVKMMGGGHGHGHDEPFYLHLKHIYNLDRVKFQKVKMPLAVWSAIGVGIFVPVCAVTFH
ncbi:hypothetical protein Droror1_Dr00004796 [Drosera rotundifolia]